MCAAADDEHTGTVGGTHDTDDAGVVLLAVGVEETLDEGSVLEEQLLVEVTKADEKVLDSEEDDEEEEEEEDESSRQLHVSASLSAGSLVISSCSVTASVAEGGGMKPTTTSSFAFLPAIEESTRWSRTSKKDGDESRNGFIWTGDGGECFLAIDSEEEDCTKRRQVSFTFHR